MGAHGGGTSGRCGLVGVMWGPHGRPCPAVSASMHLQVQRGARHLSHLFHLTITALAAIAPAAAAAAAAAAAPVVTAAAGAVAGALSAAAAALERPAALGFELLLLLLLATERGLWPAGLGL